MAEVNSSNKPLRMVTCGACQTRNFISGDLPSFATVPCCKCGHPVMLPVILRQFELRSVIASGGMGTVFNAFDVNLQRNVALKMMKREMAEDQEVLESFYREARAGASLNHSNIVHIYTFDEIEGQPYLVMEVANNGSLDTRIAAEGSLPELDVLDVGIKIASALDSALKKNLLHRDIKPGNILFNHDAPPEPKLVDFGLAREAETDQDASSESTVWGTPYYVAPEKIKREPETFLSDLYSLGGTLYHALTGHVPFEAPTVQDLVAAHVHTALTPPNLVVPEISQATSDALIKAMAKEPFNRFQSYDEFIMALESSRSPLLWARYNQPEPDTGKGWWRKK